MSSAELILFVAEKNILVSDFYWPEILTIEEDVSCMHKLLNIDAKHAHDVELTSFGRHVPCRCEDR